MWLWLGYFYFIFLNKKLAGLLKP